MSAYCSITDVQSRISAADLIGALNDGAGNLDQITLNLLIQHASGDVDGKLQSIYQTPFASPYPSGVTECALAFTCSSILKRVLTPEEKNPFAEEAKMWSAWLIKIQSGVLTLDNAISRAFPPVIPFTACMSTAFTTR